MIGWSFARRARGHTRILCVVFMIIIIILSVHLFPSTTLSNARWQFEILMHSHRPTANDKVRVKSYLRCRIANGDHFNPLQILYCCACAHPSSIDIETTGARHCSRHNFVVGFSTFAFLLCKQKCGQSRLLVRCSHSVYQIIHIIDPVEIR